MCFDFFCVSCQVGEDYLGLLPESMPFLSELLEDDSEAVTTRAREVARLIEDMTGESISAYL